MTNLHQSCVLAAAALSALSALKRLCRWRVPVQVFALWFSPVPDAGAIAGIDVFFFGDDLKIKSIASFHEPPPPARARFLKSGK